MVKKEYTLDMDSEERNMDIIISYSNTEDIKAFIELINDCLPNNMGLYEKEEGNNYV